MKDNLTHISLHLIWFHEICRKYVKSKPPRTIIRKNAIFPCLPRLHVVDIGWPVSHEKVVLTGDCFFIILPEIKIGSFTIEFRWSWSLNKFRTGTFCRIVKYSTEHLKVPNNLYSYSYILLTIKKKRVIFSESKQIPQRNTILSQENTEISKKIPSFARMLWVCPPNYNPEHINKVLTEHLILSVSPDFVLSRTPNFLMQKHTSQWLLSNASYFLRKGKTEKLFHTSRSSRPEVFCK